MVSNRQLTKTEKCRRVLEESLQEVDKLDIKDLLQAQQDLINEIIVQVEDIRIDAAASNYIFGLVSACNFLFQTISSKFITEEL